MLHSMFAKTGPVVHAACTPKTTMEGRGKGRKKIPNVNLVGKRIVPAGEEEDIAHRKGPFVTAPRNTAERLEAGAPALLGGKKKQRNPGKKKENGCSATSCEKTKTVGHAK